jgi:hypothetical protein
MNSPNEFTYGSILVPMDSDEINEFQNRKCIIPYTIDDNGIWFFISDLIEKISLSS